MGVAAEQGPPEAEGPRSKPYPQPALPLTYNLELLKPWGEEIAPFWSQPSAKNSVPYRGRAVCSRKDVLAGGRIRLEPAPPAALGQRPVPHRARQPDRAGGPVYERTSQRVGVRAAAPQTLPRHERAAQPHVATV